MSSLACQGRKGRRTLTPFAASTARTPPPRSLSDVATIRANRINGLASAGEWIFVLGSGLEDFPIPTDALDSSNNYLRSFIVRLGPGRILPRATFFRCYLDDIAVDRLAPADGGLRRRVGRSPAGSIRLPPAYTAVTRFHRREARRGAARRQSISRLWASRSAAPAHTFLSEWGSKPLAAGERGASSSWGPPMPVIFDRRGISRPRIRRFRPLPVLIDSSSRSSIPRAVWPSAVSSGTEAPAPLPAPSPPGRMAHAAPGGK